MSYKSITDQAIKDIFNKKTGKLTGIHEGFFTAYTNNLTEAVKKVLNSGTPADEYYLLQQQLTANVRRFAAFKSYHATQQVIRQLADKDGVLRNEEEYIKAARRVVNKFNRYQVVEHNTTVSRSRTARQWQQFSKNRSVPNLRWLPSRSAEKRETHQKYYNMVLPKTDSFWIENQPGNLFNCKCDWEETESPAATNAPKGGKPQNGLEGNPGENYVQNHRAKKYGGMVFTDNSTYFTQADFAAVESSILNLSPDTLYTRVKGVGNIDVDIHLLHGQNEISSNLAVLNVFFKHTKNVSGVKLLPNLSGSTLKHKKDYYSKDQLPRKSTKNADALISFQHGMVWVADIKLMTGSGSKLKERLTDAYYQGDYAIIKILGSVNTETIRTTADTFMKKHFKFKGIIIYNNEDNVIYSHIK